ATLSSCLVGRTAAPRAHAPLFPGAQDPIVHRGPRPPGFLAGPRCGSHERNTRSARARWGSRSQATGGPSMSEGVERHLWVWYTPFGMGGVETYLLNMARETCRAGIPFWIAAIKEPEGPLRKFFADAGAQMLDWSGFHPAFMGKAS